MESAIATKFVALAQDKPSWPQIDIPKAIEWVQTDVNIKLGESQKAALTQALTSKVVVITGALLHQPSKRLSTEETLSVPLLATRMGRVPHSGCL